MSVLIKGGRVVTGSDDFTGDIYAENGTVTTIGRSLDVEADKVIDASGKYVLPGCVDPHTHLDMPFGGTTTIDDVESGQIAAAFGALAGIAPEDRLDTLPIEGAVLAGALRTQETTGVRDLHGPLGMKVAVPLRQEPEAHLGSLDGLHVLVPVDRRPSPRLAEHRRRHLCTPRVLVRCLDRVWTD